MRGLARRLRSSIGIRSSRMTIRSHTSWYWRWLLNLLMMAAVGGVVWWLVENSYRITGFNFDEARQQIAALGEENRTLKRDLESSRSSLTERDRQLQIEKASQSELARTVAQLQDENARLKKLVAELTEKRYPLFEEIDGRLYFANIDLGARKLALLLLAYIYPERMAKEELIASLIRHGETRKNARLGISRLKNLIDDDGEACLRLRTIGLKEAEQLLRTQSS